MSTTPHHKTALARAGAAIARAAEAGGLRKPGPVYARLGAPGWVWPLPKAADGRKPTISDGYHTAEDIKAGKAKRLHRGADIMFWRPLDQRGSIRHPWQSAGFEIIPGTLAIAAGPGVVTVARQLPTGWAICIDHGGGVETAYHHLAGITVELGKRIEAGQAVGLVGGSPRGYGLCHLHFDLVVRGRFVDPGPYLRTWPIAERARVSSASAMLSS